MMAAGTQVRKESVMPVIRVEGPRIADLTKRRKLARDFTQAASDAFGLPKEAIVIVLHEISPECVASGGELICDRRAAGGQSTPATNT